MDNWVAAPPGFQCQLASFWGHLQVASGITFKAYGQANPVIAGRREISTVPSTVLGRNNVVYLRSPQRRDNVVYVQIVKRDKWY